MSQDNRPDSTGSTGGSSGSDGSDAADDRDAIAGGGGGDTGGDERTTVIPTSYGAADADEYTTVIPTGPGTAGADADERAATAAGYGAPYAGAGDADYGQAPTFRPGSSSAGAAGPGQYGQPSYGQGPYGQQDAYGRPAQPGDSQYGQAQPGQGQPGQSQPGQSQYGQGQPGQSQYGQGQYGQGQYGQGQYGQSQYGQSQPGQGQYGQSQPGQGQYGQGRYPGQYPSGAYGQPARGGSATAYAPWAPAGGTGRAEPGTQRRGRAGILVAAGVLAILLGGGAGLAAAELVDNGTTSAAAPAASVAPVTPQPTVSAMGGSDTAVEQVANSALPSVVAITVLNGQTGDTGSGVVLSADGLILTNNHVIAAGATGGTITVSFNDGSNVKASIVGRDPVTDLAVLKVPGKTTLKAATLGDSNGVAVGQSVVAVGSPLGLNGTVTTGIISALNRPVTSSGESSTDQTTTVNAMQTDAPINPGNSGGPLLNLSGQVIGINSSIAALPSSSGSQSGSIGLGFAIPINQITPIVQQLETTGKATHAQLGVSVETTQDAATGLTTGATLHSVLAGKAAAQAGLKVGDVITAVQGRLITDEYSLIATIHSYRPGNKVSVTFTRGGRSMTVAVTLDSDS